MFSELGCKTTKEAVEPTFEGGEFLQDPRFISLQGVLDPWLFERAKRISAST